MKKCDELGFIYMIFIVPEYKITSFYSISYMQLRITYSLSQIPPLQLDLQSTAIARA